MTASVEHLHGLYYKLTAQIPIAEVEAVFEREQRRAGAHAAADADAREGNPAWEQALEISRDQAYRSALEQTGTRAIGEPEYEWVRREPGADCLVLATVETFPEVDLSGLAAIEIEQPVAQVTDEDISDALDLLRWEYKTFRTVEQSSQPGDRVVFDFEGTLNGESFERSSGKGAAAILGEGNILDDMEAALLGRSAGETFDTPVTFPDDYAVSALRGETAQFHIVVSSVAEPELPELEPELIKKLGAESGELEELREQVRDRLHTECERARHRYERRQVTEALLEAVPVELPETLLNHEIQRIRQSFDQGKTSQDQESSEPEEQPLPEEPLQATAKRRVALSLILSELIRQHDIRLDDSGVERKLDELSTQFGGGDELKQRYRDDEQVMHNVRALVIEDKGFRAAAESVQKKTVNMSVDELLQASGITA